MKNIPVANNCLNVSSRRHFLQTTLLGAAAGTAACAPAASAPAQPTAPSVPAAPAPAVDPPAWETEWNNLVVAAKQEGKVVVNYIDNKGSPRKGFEAFESAFPGITVELTTMASGSLFHPKVLAEQQAGVFAWDLNFTGIPQGSALRDANALDPIKPLLFRPDVMDDKVWQEGFAFGFMDKEQQWGYGFFQERSPGFWINTDLVREGEIKSVRDLLNPKWKGNLIFADPRSGYTYSVATAIRLGFGEDVMKGIFVEQQPSYSRDSRLITEALVRGKNPVGLGVVPSVLDEFKAQGVGQQVKEITLPDLLFSTIGSIMWRMRNAPHPNATKVLANWVLTKEGQIAMGASTRINSRRLDVPVADPVTALTPGLKLVMARGREAGVAEDEKTQKILLELIR